MCLQFQYSFCDTVYRNSLLIKKVSNRIKKRQSEIRGKKYHVILAQVIRDTLQSNTYYLGKYHVLLFPDFQVKEFCRCYCMFKKVLAYSYSSIN